MKILHLPLTVPGSEQVGQERGFREVFGDQNYAKFDYLPMEGQEGKEQTNRALVATIGEFQPDIIWYQRQETDTITPNTLKEIREKYPKLWMTTWSGDARDYAPVSLTQVLPYFDIFYNDTDQVEMFKPHLEGCRYEFMPIAIDPEEGTDYSHPTGVVPEIIFVGNHYGETFSNGPFRKKLMIALSREFGDKFGVYGTGWHQGEVNWVGMCPVKHQGAYYNRAKVVISVDHIKGILHWSERLVWALMSGTPVVMEYQPGIEKHFGMVKGLVTFKDINEAVEKIHYLLSEPSLVGEDNQQFMLKHHTWKQRAERVRLDYENRHLNTITP